MIHEPQDFGAYPIPYNRVPHMRPDNEVILFLAAVYHSRLLILQVSFAKTPSGEQVVDLSALIRRRS